VSHYRSTRRTKPSCGRVYMEIIGLVMCLSIAAMIQRRARALRNVDLSRLRSEEKPAPLVIRDTTGYPPQYYRRIWGALLSIGKRASNLTHARNISYVTLAVRFVKRTYPAWRISNRPLAAQASSRALVFVELGSSGIYSAPCRSLCSISAERGLAPLSVLSIWFLQIAKGPRDHQSGMTRAMELARELSKFRLDPRELPH
jgi:hypothetical protein